MKFHPTPFSGVWLIEPTLVADERGWFTRTFCSDTFREKGLRHEFVQANHSHCVQAGILRGLHYQVPPSAEAKLVRCIRGEVFDVIVDVRKGSATFLQWFGQTLSADNRCMIYVPEGFAHGYQAIEAGSELAYQASSAYAPKFEHRIRFDDPRIGIKWPIEAAILSPKDESTTWLDSDFQGVLL